MTASKAGTTASAPPDEDEPRAVPTGGDNDEQAQEHERARPRISS